MSQGARLFFRISEYSYYSTFPLLYGNIRVNTIPKVEGIHMSEKMTSINPQILVWCREASGVSFEEASKKFGADRLSNWENGVDHPTYTQLQQLCDFYRKPVAVCFFPEPPVFKSLSTSFRTIPSIIKDNLLNRNTIKQNPK